MADIDYDDYGASPRISAGQVQNLVQISGAVCSLALIVGVGLWGYRLAVRDVTGVPVIRAVEGLARVAPENPGGDVADHQGMAVNVIAAAGETGAMPQEIVLAPEPLDLAEEDTAGLTSLVIEASAQSPAPSVTPDVAALSLETSASVAAAPEDSAFEPGGAAPLVQAAPAVEDAVARALAEALAGDVVPLEAVAEAPASEGAVARSPRPMARPASLDAGVAVTGAVDVSAALPLVNEIDPASLKVGTRLVQLGAYDSPELARVEWGHLLARFGDLMSGKAAVIQSAQSGGRTFYRLRAHGFDGEADARRFCEALVAEDAACIPAAHR